MLYGLKFKNEKRDLYVKVYKNKDSLAAIYRYSYEFICIYKDKNKYFKYIISSSNSINCRLILSMLKDVYEINRKSKLKKIYLSEKKFDSEINEILKNCKSV